MGWLVMIVLLLFYFLGLFVFHATGPIHILPFVAVASLIGYLWVLRRYGR